MKRFFFGLIIILCLKEPIVLLSQDSYNPYTLNTNRELAYFSTGVILNLGGLLLKPEKSPFTQQEYLFDTSTAGIPSFDIKAVEQNNEKFLELSNIFLVTAFALPFLSLTDGKMNDEAGTTVILYFESLLITTGIWSCTTGLISRRRPYTYNPDVGFEAINAANAKDSYFSGHTALSATAAFCGARVFCDFKPDSKLKPVIWGVATTLPAFIGLARYKAGRHFPSDVITGYILGASVGYLVPTLHKIDKKDRLSLYPGYNGVAMTYAF